jgi:S1-C subfamily serine protease
MLRILSLMFLITSIALCQSAPPRKDIPSIARAANGAVVSIIMSDVDGNVTAKGTGFFITRDGHILTNYHVIDDEHSVPTIKLRGGTLLSVDELLAFDKERDIAILKVNGEFRTVSLGDSDKLQVGEEVVAIGNPLSLESTVSNGIVSAIRSVQEGGDKILQITAPISPGSSGGPLFNMRGEVIGITTAKLEGGENLNFAIPINDIGKALFESEGPVAAADLSGDYACDVDVIETHITLSVVGAVLVLTYYSKEGNPGEFRFLREGHIWIAREYVDGHWVNARYNLKGPPPSFSITSKMKFFLANTFFYDKSRGQITTGTLLSGNLPPMTLSGTCKGVPPR